MPADIKHLYDEPLYYDVAFAWDPSAEVALLTGVFDRHVPFAVRRVLEPACGTGRLLAAMAMHGYELTGYDIHPPMVDFARQRIRSIGLAQRVSVVQGEMTTARIEPVFDAAFNLINSMGYLRDDDQIIAHLRHTGESLQPGGVYIVQLGCVHDDLTACQPEQWTMERDGVRVELTWTVVSQDVPGRISQQLCRLSINDHGRRIELEEPHALRLWTFDDIQRLAAVSEVFTLDAIYDEDHTPVETNLPVTGDMGNLYYVLKRL